MATNFIVSYIKANVSIKIFITVSTKVEGKTLLKQSLATIVITRKLVDNINSSTITNILKLLFVISQ